MTTQAKKIPIKKIITNPKYYPRLKVDQQRILEFVEAMECGEHYPPIKVVFDKKTGMYILLDGKHRLEARILRGEVEILADVFSISEEHWLMAAARFNSKSSKPLKGEEIKQIIIQAWLAGIKDTDVIAREMNCSVRYVEKMLKPIRDEKRDKIKEEILELHQQGMSQRKIASEVGLSLCSINMAIKSNEKNNNDPAQISDEDILRLPDNPPEAPQVFYKRTEFVYRTPKDNNDIRILNESMKESDPDHKEIYPINSMEMASHEAGQEMSESEKRACIQDESIKKPTEDISKASATPLDENNDDKQLSNSPEKSGSNFKDEAPINPTQTAPLSVDIQPHNENSPVKKTMPYPTYLDQIDAYNKLPIQHQHVIRAMELAKHYKVDIIDIAKEINEPVIWTRKVLVAATALSLMHSDKLNDASSVETLIGINFDTAKLIQCALSFRTMLCPVSPDMEQWVKNNFSSKDLDLILSLVDANKNDLPHLLKGETPPKETNRFKSLPEDYKAQLEAGIALLRELRDHTKNKRFNSDSAKQLLAHLNKNVTVINEIVDGLREDKLL